MPIMFRCPGDERHVTRGFLYDCRDMPDRDAALADGWFDTLEQAAGIAPPAVAEPQALPDDAPPTRDEMLAQLAKLGVDVDKRWGDKRLAAEIAKAMEAK